MLEDYPVLVRAVAIGTAQVPVERVWMWPHATVADAKIVLRINKGQLCHNGVLLQPDVPLRDIAANDVVDVGVRSLRIAPLLR